MTEQVHNVTSVQSKRQKRLNRVKKGATYGIYAAGCILLIDDALKTVSSKVRKNKKTTEN